MALRIALGPSYRTVLMVEREAYAAALLAHRMEAGDMDPCPIWTDLTTLDCSPWRGRVGIVSAGFPCQPWSQAGNRRGVEDERWIWPDIVRILREVGPSYVLLENVPGLLVRGLGHVLGPLAELGFDAEWGVYSAAEVGAPHLRRRVFILAAPPGSKRLRLQPGRPEPGRADSLQPRGDGQSEPPADPNGQGGLQPSGLQRQERGRAGDGCSADAPDAPCPGRQGSGPQQQGGRGQLACLAGGQWKETVPPVCRANDATPNRVDRLRALGNAVVPLQAARAFLDLSRRLGVLPNT